MGREGPLTGQAGEDYARGFLRGSFRDIAKSSDGAALDFTATELRSERRSTILCQQADIRFHFQVKHDRGSLDIARSTFLHWLARVESQPVFLLRIQTVSDVAQEYSFVPIHEWLFSRAGQQALADQSGEAKFHRRDLQRSDPHGRHFHYALLKEAERAAQVESADFRTLRDYGIFPFDEATFLLFLETAPRAEVPRGVIELLRGQTSKLPQLVGSRLDVAPVDVPSEVRAWWAEVRHHSAPAASNSHERRQLLRFAQALRHFRVTGEVPKRLPPYKRRYVACWRAFAAMFPASVRMLHAVILRSHRREDVIFASAVLPVLALSPDRSLEPDVEATLSSLAAHADSGPIVDLESYRFGREVNRGLAESGKARFLGRARDIIGRHEHRPYEVRYLTSYGWPPETHSDNIRRKLDQPTLRDEKLRPFYETMAAVLLE